MKIFGISGYSGSGKTTLIEGLIPVFGTEGLRVSVIKHAHHLFDVDSPGKDSYRHRQAGATEVLVSSSMRWALMHELGKANEPTVSELLERLSPCDLVLVEGFKRQAMPKIEVHRVSSGVPLLFPTDPTVVAIATDEPLDTQLQQLDLNHPDVVAAFIISYLGF